MTTIAAVADLKITSEAEKIGSSSTVYCLACGAVGKTLFYTATVPSFGGMDLSSFSCDECGYHYAKTEATIKSETEFSKLGMLTTLKVTGEVDLQRSVVISDEAAVIIPELEFSVRSLSGGRITTVEGCLAGLASELKRLNIVGGTDGDGEAGEKKNIVASLEKLLTLDSGTFNFSIRDPLNKSFISPRAKDEDAWKEVAGLRDKGIVISDTVTKNDTNITLEPFKRSKDEDETMGLVCNENQDADQGERALWGKEFDKQYEFIPNPNNEPSVVTVTKATTKECCDFLLQMSGERLSGEDDY